MQGFSPECLILSGSYLLSTCQSSIIPVGMTLLLIGIFSSLVRYTFSKYENQIKEKNIQSKTSLFNSLDDIVKTISNVANDKTIH